jgi:hypothetical protein
MAARTTYKKRQKELARQEKLREKVAKRAQRKLDKESGLTPQESDEDLLAAGAPQEYDDSLDRLDVLPDGSRLSPDHSA